MPLVTYCVYFRQGRGLQTFTESSHQTIFDRKGAKESGVCQPLHWSSSLFDGKAKLLKQQAAALTNELSGAEATNWVSCSRSWCLPVSVQRVTTMTTCETWGVNGDFSKHT